MESGKIFWRHNAKLNIFLSLLLGHRNPQSLIHYNPTATVAQKEDRAFALQTRTRRPPPTTLVSRQDVNPPEAPQEPQAGGSGLGGGSHLKECPFGCTELFRTKVELYNHITMDHEELSQDLDESFPGTYSFGNNPTISDVFFLVYVFL